MTGKPQVAHKVFLSKGETNETTGTEHDISGAHLCVNTHLLRELRLGSAEVRSILPGVEAASGEGKEHLVEPLAVLPQDCDLPIGCQNYTVMSD